MDVVIRPYQLGDEYGICEAHKLSIQKICSQDYASDIIKVWSAVTPDGYITSMKKRGEKFWVIDDNAKIAGFSGWIPESIEGFYIHPNDVGKGLGRMLFEVTEKDMLENSRTSTCEISSSLTAKSFYEKMGFKPIKKYIDTLCRNGAEIKMDAWQMRKDY